MNEEQRFFNELGDGIVVLFTLDAAPEAGERREAGGVPREVGAWLHVGADGRVTAFTGKVEVGQGIRTALTQVIAEELPAPLGDIRLVMGDTELCPFDGGTSGSRTTPGMAPRLRQAAAAARELLLDRAAQAGPAARGSLFAANGKVVDRETGREFPFGELARGQRRVTAVGEGVATRPAAAWEVAGQPAPRVEARAVVTGKHRYTSDMKRPGMGHGKVLRPPAFQATLAALDTSAAEALPGVTVVREGEFVGVVGPDDWTAARAVEAIRAEWRVAAGQPSGEELFDYLRRHPGEARGRGGPSVHTVGSIDEGLAAAERTLAGTYTVAYIAHAPLEPRAAVAEWSDGRLTVWTGTQCPFRVRGELAEVLGIAEAQVRVIVPDTGSGYGGKHSGEAAVEAARLARAAGRPVKLVWTREEEFTWAYFRPAGVIDIRSGVTADGTITAWECHNTNSGGSAIRPPYPIPHQQCEFHPAQSPLRQGSYRALAATANHFARETHLDELAHAVGMDPLAFRLKNLQRQGPEGPADPERLRAVLEAAAERFRWDCGLRIADCGLATKTGSPDESGRSLPTIRNPQSAIRNETIRNGRGIAGGFEKGSYVATCAEVEVEAESGRVRVVRVVTAFECGAVLNPDNLVNQVEGAVMMGLGGALFEGIRFADGRILNPRFSEYRVPRFTDAPRLETVLVERKDLPSVGGGETPIVAIAPAVGNALFAATGVRRRSLPLGAVGEE